jgi:hypothetical protein
VYAGPRGEEIFDRRRSLLIAQAERVVDVQLAQRRIEIDLPPIVRKTNERTEDRLTHGMNIDWTRHIAHLDDDPSRVTNLRGADVRVPQPLSDTG